MSLRPVDTHPALRSLAVACLCLALIASGPQAGGQETPARRQLVDQKHLLGQITRIDGSALELRPWDYRLPRRIEVPTTDATTYLRQRKVKLADLQPGDPVVAVPDERVRGQRKPPEDRDPENVPRPLLLGLFRLWLPRDQIPDPSFAPRARSLILAALPLFSEEERNQRLLRDPTRQEGALLGVLTRLDPITIRLETKRRHFDSGKHLVVLDNQVIPRGELDRPETVLLRSPEGLGRGATGAADLVIMCRPPHLTGFETRRYWAREQGHK